MIETVKKVKLAYHRGKPVLDVPWPDGLRSRLRVASEEAGTRLKLQVQMALVEDNWRALRAVLQEKESEATGLISGRFSAVIDEYYRAYVQPRNRSLRSKKSFLDRFNAQYGQLPLRALDLRHADQYIAMRKRSGVKSSTINRELACLRHLFQWAMDRGYTERNPFHKLDLLPEQEVAQPVPTDEIVNSVISELESTVRPVFTLIRETGARKGEVLGLKRWCIDRERRMIIFTQTKTNRNRLVPITDRALEALDSVPPLPGCPYQFYDPETGTRWKTLRSQWERARERAGYPWLTTRHFRPAFATALSERGLETHLIQDLLGHSSVSVTERFYVRRRQEAACRAALQVLQTRTT